MIIFFILIQIALTNNVFIFWDFCFTLSSRCSLPYIFVIVGCTNICCGMVFSVLTLLSVLSMILSVLLGVNFILFVRFSLGGVIIE